MPVLLVLLALITALAACGEDSPPEPPPPPYVLQLGLREYEFSTIGDSVRVPVSVVNPRPSAPPSLSWLSRDTVVAAVSASGDVRARRNGSTWVVVSEAGGSRDSVRIVVAHRSGLRITPGNVDLAFVGDTARVVATQARPVPGQAADYFWTVRDTLVARVTQSGALTAMGAGATFVLAQDQVGGRDSVAVRVTRSVELLLLTPRDSVVAQTSALRLQAVFADRHRLPVSLAGQSIRWTSSRGTAIDSSRTFNSGGYAWITPLAMGVDTIRATVGVVSAMAVLAVRERARLEVATDTIYSAVGASPMQPRFLRVVPLTDAAPATVTFDIDDNTIARLSQSDDLGAGGAMPDIIGLRNGVTSVVIRSAGAREVRIPVRVSALKVVRESATARPVAGRNTLFRWFFRDAASGQEMINEIPRTMDFFSTDTTAVRMPTQRGVTLPPRAPITAFFLTADPGRTAYLVLRILGNPPDSVPVTISSGSMIYSRYSVMLTPTNREKHVAGLGDQVFYQPDRYPAQATTIYFSRTNPSIATWPDSLFVPVNLLQAWRNISWTGLKVGVDTIVAYGPGMRGDTLILTLDSARFGPDVPPARVHAGASITVPVSERNRALVRRAAIEDSIPVDVRSSDPTVLRVDQPRVLVSIADGSDLNSGRVRVTGLRRGTASLTFTSPRPWAGSYTTPPIDVVRNQLRMPLLSPQEARISLGFRQLTSQTPVRFEFDATPTATPVTLRSTDTTIVTLTHSAVSLFPPPATDVRFVAGSRSGMAWVVASMPGLEPDSVEVVVGPPRLALSPVLAPADSLTRWRLDAERRTPDGGSSIRALDSLTVAFESSDTTVATVSPSRLSIPGGFAAARGAQVRFKRVPLPGAPQPRVFIRVRDVGNGAVRYGDAVIELTYSSFVTTSGRVGPEAKP